MQWTVFMLSSVVLVAAKIRSENKDDFGVGFFDSRDEDKSHERLWNPRHQKDFYEMLNTLNENSGSSDLKVLRKRALSALSRWKPLGSLGVRVKTSHRLPSRAPMMSMVPEMNLVSAETSDGVRPLGQPLRWGKKR